MNDLATDVTAHLTEELADKEEHERELKEVNTRLDQLVASLAEIDEELENLREKRREHQRNQERLQILDLNAVEIEQRLEALDKERHYLEKQQREDEEHRPSPTPNHLLKCRS